EARESACRVTGVTDKRFLVASHIKPWRVSSNDERLDGANGLILSPHIDKLFDQGWISFSDDGDLLIAPDFPRDVIDKWNVAINVAKDRLPRSKENILVITENIYSVVESGRNLSKVFATLRGMI